MHLIVYTCGIFYILEKEGLPKMRPALVQQSICDQIVIFCE